MPESDRRLADLEDRIFRLEDKLGQLALLLARHGIALAIVQRYLRDLEFGSVRRSKGLLEAVTQASDVLSRTARELEEIMNAFDLDSSDELEKLFEDLMPLLPGDSREEIKTRFSELLLKERGDPS